LNRAALAVTRTPLLRWGLLLAGATVLWNILDGIIAVLAGTRAQSVALLGFGIDSFVGNTSPVCSIF
jgi:hypothetical protein